MPEAHSSTLPIEAIKTDFLQALTEYSTLVLSAPPGAGKSTRLPLWLFDIAQFSRKKIYLLQPRRLAVKNIANYLAQQLGEKVGNRVGYRLRNETKVSKNTQLEVITEGILTQIIQQDPELENCALVIFDEFHERSLHGDLAFALTREVQQSLRDDLKILLMSATLDSDYLLNALPDAKNLVSKGRSFPVDISYSAPSNLKQWRAHALSVIKEKAFSHQGSILVFLPGVADINFLCSQLKNNIPENVLLCPLYGELSLKQQQQAIMPCVDKSVEGVSIEHKVKHKLVLATNIAETSLTIEGINLVIDCGLEKVAIYDSASLMNSLLQKQIAKASATQRAGRAGRLMAGECIRLYSNDDYQRRPEQSVNDIQQADLLPTLIEAARWGVNALADLPMLELPSKVKEQQAWQELLSLAIVNEKYQLTAHGKNVAQLPCHPRFAHMILSASQLPQTQLAVSLACLLAALLEERDIFNNDQAQANSDLRHRLQLFTDNKIQRADQQHKCSRILQQAQVLAKRAGGHFTAKNLPLNLTGVLLAFAYPERIAKARSNHGDFLCANGKGVSVNEQDALAAHHFIVVAHLQQGRANQFFSNKGGSKGANKGGVNNSRMATVKLAAEINLADIEQFFASSILQAHHASYDSATGRISAKQQTKLGAIVLSEQNKKQALTADDIAAMWCELVQQKGLNFLHWQTKDKGLLARWRWLNQYVPEANLPCADHDTLINKLDIWLAPFVGDIKSKAQLDKLNLSQLLLSLLNYQQQQVFKQAAPTVFIGPTGRHCPITYGEEKSPKVSMPMQELYGETQTPSVGKIANEQGIPLLLELLSPAKRPIQITQDLIQFWQGSYQAVQKDMKAQYPKHYWPDDPLNAKPTNKVKRLIEL